MVIRHDEAVLTQVTQAAWQHTKVYENFQRERSYKPAESRELQMEKHKIVRKNDKQSLEQDFWEVVKIADVCVKNWNKVLQMLGNFELLLYSYLAESKIGKHRIKPNPADTKPVQSSQNRMGQ